jgi:hypothetical protein
MAKFVLKANPTFTSKVAFPVAGGAAVDVVVTFKHRTKTALAEFMEWRDGKKDPEIFEAMVVGWDLSDEFSAENVEILLENHIGVALAVYKAYLEELVQNKLKN